MGIVVKDSGVLSWTIEILLWCLGLRFL